MHNRPAPFGFTVLRRFHVLTGAGAAVAVFFQPLKAAGNQKPDAHTQKQHRQCKPEGLRSV